MRPSRLYCALSVTTALLAGCRTGQAPPPTDEGGLHRLRSSCASREPVRLLISHGGGPFTEVTRQPNREAIVQALCRAEGRQAIWLDQSFDLLVFSRDGAPITGFRCWTAGSNGLAALELEPMKSSQRLEGMQSWRVKDYQYEGLRVELGERDLRQALAASEGDVPR